MTATVTTITTTGVTAANSNLYRFLANIASTSADLPGSFTGVDTIDKVKIKFTSASNDLVYSNGSPSSGTITGLTIVFHGKTILTEAFSPGLDIAAIHAAADTFFNSNYTDHSALDAIFNTISYDFPGNKGPDQFGGGGVADTIHGGAGNDTILGTLGADILDGDSGINTLSYANDTVGVTLGLGGLNLSGAGSLAELDVISNFRNLIGGSGFDDLGGDNLANKLIGGGGDDFLEGNGGNDKLIGGVGIDTAGYDQAARAVKVSLAIKLAQNTRGAGKDTLVGIENLFGSHFADKLTGDKHDNKLFGGSGNDHLKGGGGNDTLNGDANDDSLNGEAGNDTLNGGTGNDLLQGGTGDDTLNGGDGADNLQGSTGNDTLNGDANNDILQGGSGNDTLHGGSEDDVLDGGSGNDTLDGDTGNDTATYASATKGVVVDLSILVGQNTLGAGTDTLANIDNLIGSKFADHLTGDANDNVIEGGLGNDTLDGGGNTATGDTISYAHAKSAVNINLAAGTVTGGDGSDTISGFENIIGSNFNDLLIAATGGSTINGGGGNDTIVASAGADVLDGGSGINTLSYANDTTGVFVGLFTGSGSGGDAAGDLIHNFQNVIGGTGDDHLNGDDGNNRIDCGAGDDIVNPFFGDDTLIGGTNNASGDSLDFDIAALTSGVTVNLSLTTAQDTGAGIKTITGFENIAGSVFDDVLTGNADINHIGGGDGDDVIRGGAGADFLDGGNNNAGGGDWVSYAGSTLGVTVDLNTTIQGGVGDAAGDHLSTFENIIGSSHDDTLTGDGGDNVIEGGLGADIMDGGFFGGNDTVVYLHSTAGVTVDLSLGTQVSAGDANGDVLSNFDNIIGSAHNDTLKGDAGSNFLIGGLGADTLTGDTGADTFLFTSFAESNGDHITDFETGSDTLAVGFTAGPINLDASGTPVAADGNAWFLYDTDDGKLFFDADGNGAGAAVLFVTLDGAPTLAASDFVVI